jgi:progressive ankylosis protein
MGSRHGNILSSANGKGAKRVRARGKACTFVLEMALNHANRPSAITHDPLTIRVAVLFFLPLIISTELHQLSHSLVHAFLARLGDATITLAAFSIAFAFNTTLSGVISVQVQAGLSYITDKRSFWRIARFYFLFSLLPFLAIEAFALTPLGDWLFGVVIGASPEATRLAKHASAVMGLWIFPNQVRNMATALCMMHRRTLPISYATVIRIVSQAFMLMVLPFWMEGAVAGAASLVGCMTVEAIYMYWVSRAYYDELPEEGEQASYRHMWRFSWPLMVTQVTENGVPLVINFFLGRLAHPDLALAAFGVVNALKSLVASPLRNMAQTAQALVHSREDMDTILRFANRVTLVYVLLVGVLFYTPMRDVILSGVMGLPATLSAYATPGVQMVLLVVIAWGYASLFRGMLAAMRRTGAIAASAVMRLLVVTMVGSVTLIAPDLNGAAVGVTAVGAAFLTESLILGWRLLHFKRKTGSLFAGESATNRG